MTKEKQQAKKNHDLIIQKASATFDHLNKQHFKGKLKPIPIHLTEKDDFKAAIYYKPTCRIVLSLPFLEQTNAHDFRQAILHEMIHYFFYFFGIKDSSSILIGHSTRFKRVARRLGMNFY